MKRAAVHREYAKLYALSVNNSVNTNIWVRMVMNNSEKVGAFLAFTSPNFLGSRFRCAIKRVVSAGSMVQDSQQPRMEMIRPMLMRIAPQGPTRYSIR